MPDLTEIISFIWDSKHKSVQTDV